MRKVVSPTKEAMTQASEIVISKLNKLSRSGFLNHYKLPSNLNTVQAVKAATEIEFKELLKQNG